MTLLKTMLAVFALSLITAPGHTMTLEEGEDGAQSETTKTITDYIDDYIDVPEGALDWKILGTTKEIEVQTKTQDGYDWVYYKPEFQDNVKALDGQIITIKGSMFPLNETDDQKLFLLGPFPLSCPFHYHVGPALVLEVHADAHPVPFTYDPVILTGTLQIVHDDPENNVFYKLLDARQVR